ncbi:hypothetical protein [Streptomyces pseudogriseolus]|uniref:hypothetical protein n=1 Tax=Streptomyces pseudogriseolus TaxID=36817 RepID=UPI003FA33520
MELCEDVIHLNSQAAPARWVMAEYVAPANVGSRGIAPVSAVDVAEFNACDSCARWWESQSWVNARRVRPIIQERERRTIRLEAYSFHAEFKAHKRFELVIMTGNHVFRTEVVRWGNTLRNAREFLRDCGATHDVNRAMVNIYKTGYANVGKTNIRVIPVG